MPRQPPSDPLPPPETFDLPRLGRIVIRPVRADDAARIRESFQRQTPEDLRLRFFGPVTELPADFISRATRFAPGDEVTFVAAAANGALLGGVRLARARGAGGGPGRDDRGGGAEFAITVASHVKRAGLGRLLMERMLRHARTRGLARVWGDVMAENVGMLRLAGALGFRLERLAEEPPIVRATIDLR